MRPERSLRFGLFTALSCFVFAATDVAAQTISVPAKVGPFVLADSTRFEQAELGVMYTFREEANRVIGNAYVYPVPADRLDLPAEGRIAREAENFVASLKGGVERGWYSAFQVVVDTARSFETAGGPQPGHMVVAVLRSTNGPLVSFMHLVLIGDQYVKARLTMPAEQWRTSTAPNFAIDWFAQITPPAETAP